MEGGLDATGNEIAVKRNGTWKADFPNAKAFLVALKAGDEYRLRSGGGGGYGPPWQRDIAAVRDDVKQGYVSAKAARDLYGVAIDPETLVVDEAETARLRDTLRAKA